MGVGRATTQTVVITSVVTLISDFFLTKLILTPGMGPEHGRRRSRSRFESVDKAFGKNVIYEGLDLEIREGEVLTILGGSGSARA